MKTVRTDELLTIGEFLAEACNGPLLVRDEQGRTFVLAKVDDEELERISLADSPGLMSILERSRARAEAEGWLTTDELRTQLGI